MAGVLAIQTVSAALIYGDADWGFLGKFSSKLEEWAKKGWAKLANLASAMAGGAVELWNAIKNKDWKLFQSWFEEQPIAASAGIVATGLIAGVLVSVGGLLVGAVAGGLSGLKALLLSKGGLFGVALTAPLLPSLISHMVQGTQQIYHFNWNQSDADILKEIEQDLINLYGAAGNSLGTATAGVLIGFGGGTPKVEIRMKSLVNMWRIANEDIREESLEALSRLAYSGIRVAGMILFKLTYMNARKFIKSNFKTGIPSIDKAIAAWGKESSQPWSLATAVEEKIETIPDARIRAFVENFTESFFESSGEFLQLRFDR